jgi:hypothetical protein
MKPWAPILLSILLTSGCVSDNPEALKSAARKGVFPATLASHESALEYIRQLYIRGHVDRVRIGLSRFMVVFQHGSGLPVTRIAVYQREGWRWKLVSELSPPGGRLFESIRFRRKDCRAQGEIGADMVSV